MHRWARLLLVASAALLGVMPPVCAGQPVAGAGTTSAVSQPPAAPGQEPAESQAPPEGAPIIYRGQEIGRVYRAFGPYTPEERARTAVERLDWLVHDLSTRVEDLRLTHLATSSELSVGDRIIWVITDEDAAARGLPRTQVAELAIAGVRELVFRMREELSYPEMVKGVAIALALTLLLGVLWWVVARLSRRLLSSVGQRRGGRRATRASAFGAVGVSWLVALFVLVVRLTRAALVLFLILAWLQSVLTALPWTRPYARLMVPWVVGPLTGVWTDLVNYLPDFFSLLIVVGIAYGMLRAVGAFFGAVGRGTIRLENFPAEWANPTYNLVRVLIVAMAFVAAFPYIPGSSAPAFQGVSLFLGFFFTISSSSAISNIIAGVILTYTGAFRVGERVRIADTTGDVIKKSLLVTRIRTDKNVVVAIPNSLVLGAQTLNYSAMAQGEGLVLHTAVTIGYNAPWRQIHELLISAALATRGILDEPRPFVLQTALNDFYVSYEINAYTRDPGQMLRLYSDLHANIQDTFYEAGVEIMSPHVSMLRDGNQAAIPDTYLGEAYEPGALRVRRVDK